MYFSNYDRMDGAVRLDYLKTWKSNNEILKEENSGARLFMEFLEYAGIPLDEILTVGTYETFEARLQAASNNITDQILEFWTQNPDLSVVVTIDPARPQDKPPLNENIIGRARIHNALHRVDTPFSERSAGFVWFFSFLVKFAQVKDDATPVVLLLDEPGLTLHGKAQGDLLRYFEEKLAPFHQIVYSTHSPFMVALDQLTSARVVEDQVELKRHTAHAAWNQGARRYSDARPRYAVSATGSLGLRDRSIVLHRQAHASSRRRVGHPLFASSLLRAPDTQADRTRS